MKLKKKTGIMMAAASAVAVVGIAAVSFAAWSGSNNTLTASANTGEVTLVGFADTDATFVDGDKLIPWDQDTKSAKDGAKTVISFKVSDFTVFTDYAVTIKLDSNSEVVAEVNNKPEGSTFQLYYTYTTATEGALTSVTSLEGLTELSTTASTITELAATVSGETPVKNNGYINLVLDSNYTGTKNPFENLGFNVVLTLVTDFGD